MRVQKKEVEVLIYIGKINKDKLGKYKDKIITNDAILTNERLNEHIIVEHKKDYEQLKKYLKEIIENPDYIVSDKAHDTTIIFLKEIKVLNKLGRIVVKLALPFDKEHPKNSIITLMRLNKRTWKQTLKNKGEIIFDKNNELEYNNNINKV